MTSWQAFCLRVHTHRLETIDGYREQLEERSRAFQALHEAKTRYREAGDRFHFALRGEGRHVPFLGGIPTYLAEAQDALRSAEKQFEEVKAKYAPSKIETHAREIR